MRIYVASSWRNESSLDDVILALREGGHDVYDFREDEGFSWNEIDAGWTMEKPVRPAEGVIDLLRSAPANRGFRRDLDALEAADALVLVMPCGRSAHLELGYAAGMGRQTAVYLPEPCEPELMWKIADVVTADLGMLVDLFAPWAAKI